MSYEETQETFTNRIPDPKAGYTYERFTKLGTYKMGLVKIKDAEKDPHPQAENQNKVKGYRWVFRSYDNPHIFNTPFTSATISTSKKKKKSNLKILLDNMSQGKLKEPTPEEAFNFMASCVGKWWDVDISVKKDDRNPDIIYNNLVDMGVRPNPDTSNCLEYFKRVTPQAPTNTINAQSVQTGFEGMSDMAAFDADEIPELEDKVSNAEKDDSLDIPF